MIIEDIQEAMSSFSEVTWNTRKKFDSCASVTVTGDKTRLKVVLSNDEAAKNMVIKGFNDTVSTPALAGINEDGVKEYYVPDMPKNLALLCAHAYASEGAAILTQDGGLVVKLEDEEIKNLMTFLEKYPIKKRLIVKNRTYEVVDHACEEVMSNVATRYFNTKVHVSNSTELIMVMLLSGFSYQDLYTMVTNRSVNGLHPDLTISALNTFSHKYGTTPDIIRLANPRHITDRHGLKDQPVTIDGVGKRVEIDIFEADFNEMVLNSDRHTKLKSHGGARGAAICVDAYSGFVMIVLLKAFKNSIEFIKQFVMLYHLNDVKIDTIGADSGIISQNMYEVSSKEVEEYLLKHKIKYDRAEPYNHSHGGGYVESAIGKLKTMVRTAITLLLRNPNVSVTGMSKEDILKLWGELFLWAVDVSNLKPCKKDKTKSRREVFYGLKPNVQDTRILPILSILLVPRVTKSLSTLMQVHKENRVGVYVGPSRHTKGAIRVAIKNGTRVSIIITSNFSAVSDGGGLNVHAIVEDGMKKLLENQTSMEKEVSETVTPETEITITNVYDNEDYCNDELHKTTDVLPLAEIEQKINKTTKQPRPRKKKKKILTASNVSATDINNKVVENIYERPYFTRSAMRGTVREVANFADWITHEDECCYYSFTEGEFIQVSTTNSIPCEVSEVYTAVRDDVPKTFQAALKHPLWGDAARTEWNTLIDTKALVHINKELVYDAIQNRGAEVVYLFPVYEVKEKDGHLVYKVRLVGDGSKQSADPEDTYSSTPSREELIILLHIIASLGWDFVHIDEKRAFLNADYTGDRRIFAKIRSGPEWYEVLKALYGLKTSPRHYQDKVIERLESHGYKRLVSCSCIFIKKVVEGSTIKLVLIYDYVDDFIFTSDSRDELERSVQEFTKLVDTTEPIYNAKKVLGMEIQRNHDKRIIMLSMTNKITDMTNKFKVNESMKRKRKVPMVSVDYIVKPEDLDSLPEHKREPLDAEGIAKYMAIVGVLIWISGVRFDILFSVMYLSWYTQYPRQHHLDCAYRVMEYLEQSKLIPLVLGGATAISIDGYTDSSVGTAPKGRSTYGNAVKLNPNAGAVSVSSKSTTSIHMSSFESELDGAVQLDKKAKRIRTILEELQVEFGLVTNLHGDNEAMVEFIRGKGAARGVRHMELRMWYIRESYKKGNMIFQYMPGTEIPVDQLTKVGTADQFQTFRNNILGLNLLDQSDLVLREMMWKAQKC